MPPTAPETMSPTELSRRRELILAHEEEFARRLALAVIDRPRLSVWMILIPIVFVFYFQQFHRFNAGRKSFADHYLLSRRRALDAVFRGMETETPPDVDGIVAMARLPELRRATYRRLVEALVEIYADVLKGGGETYDDLVRASFRNRGEYLLSLNRLAQAETALNRELRADMDPADDVGSVVEKMETRSRELRAADAERIFGGPREIPSAG